MDMQSFKQYSSVYDEVNKHKNYKKETKFVYEWAGKPESILDIGAGTASYWKYFPKGTQLVGIEKSPQMIKHSKHKSLIINEDILTCKFPKNPAKFDCLTALFDVVNYLPHQRWWENIPLKKGGCFIFDIWDLKKVNKEGFRTTVRKTGNLVRKIIPRREKNKVHLKVIVNTPTGIIKEKHLMYLYSQKDIQKFCGNNFKITGIKHTDNWQVWYRLEKL